jgi:hypothetical protein
MINVNISALTALTRLFLPEMIAKNHGKILNVASTAAFQPGPMMSVYYATKAYVLSFSEALSEELKGTGVTVTALCPGPTASNFQKTAGIQETKLIKGKRIATSKEVAEFGYDAMMKGKRSAVQAHGIWCEVLTQKIGHTHCQEDAREMIQVIRLFFTRSYITFSLAATRS